MKLIATSKATNTKRITAASGGKNFHDAKKPSAVINSTIGYRAEILHWQLAHLPRSQSQLNTGIFNHMGIGVRHDGQNDRFGSFTDIPNGTR
jgi:hypothetical protein